MTGRYNIKRLKHLCWQTEVSDLDIYANRQLIKVRASLGLSPWKGAETGYSWGL